MKNLRTKMIIVVFASSFVAFMISFFLVKGVLLTYHNRQADGMTLVISSYGGEIPSLSEYSEEDLGDSASGYDIEISEESAFSTRYFTVLLDSDLSLISSNLEHVASVDAKEAYEMALEAADENNTVGYCGYYRYRISENADGTCTVIFLDCEENFNMRTSVDIILGIVSLILTFLITLIFGFLSKKAMKPFEENSRRQKQFITDAGHELKTPLAIISANAAVLEYKNGENEWISNITDQTAHMSELIDNLLTLSKMDESEEIIETEQVNLSEIVSRDISSFSPLFNQKDAKTISEIEPDIIVEGNKRQLAMLISILMENASKYVSENGNVEIFLSKNSKSAVFEIFNTAVLDEKLNPGRLFERFYRPDSSRNSKTGGQGIGLSTAQKIVNIHGGSINAKKKAGGIVFAVNLPFKQKNSK